MWQKEKLLVLSNFFFCHYVFKKPSAAEASESVYMREITRLVNVLCQQHCSMTKIGLYICHIIPIPFPDTDRQILTPCVFHILKSLWKKEKGIPIFDSAFKTLTKFVLPILRWYAFFFRCFQHTTNLKQTTLKTSQQKYRKST